MDIRVQKDSRLLLRVTPGDDFAAALLWQADMHVEPQQRYDPIADGEELSTKERGIYALTVADNQNRKVTVTLEGDRDFADPETFRSMRSAEIVCTYEVY